MNYQLFRLCLGALAALALAQNTTALTLRPPSFSELVRSADFIIRGTIRSTECELRMVEGQKVPFTQVTIDVTETLKGSAAKTVVLLCLGGNAEGQTLKIVGAPELTTGADGFFFVQNNGTQFYPFVGINHGCYWNVRDEGGAERVLRDDGQPLQTAAQVSTPLRHDSRGVRSASAHATSAGLSPTDFAHQIRTEASRATR